MRWLFGTIDMRNIQPDRQQSFSWILAICFCSQKIDQRSCSKTKKDSKKSKSSAGVADSYHGRSPSGKEKKLRRAVIVKDDSAYDSSVVPADDTTPDFSISSNLEAEHLEDQGAGHQGRRTVWSRRSSESIK